jgi:hypothetical protein
LLGILRLRIPELSIRIPSRESDQSEIPEGLSLHGAQLWVFLTRIARRKTKTTTTREIKISAR